MANRTAKTGKKADKGPYKAVLLVLGKTYSAEGETVLDAISRIEPGVCRGKGVLTVSRGDARRERVVMPLALSRAFNASKTVREISAKGLASLFDL